MKKIRLVDVDSKIPNLALMQISSWHRSQGDITGFDTEDPDVVYISCVFEKNADQARGVAQMFPNSEVIIGGSGVDLKLKLPEYMQKITPDYTLYPDNKKSIGFTTRGCIRKCGFCVVPKKEGKLHRLQHISEFHNPEFKSVVCLDNNIGADKEWFFENTDFIIENNLKWNPIQGMDIRILSYDIAERLKKTKIDGILHFAFDNMRDEEKVKSGIDILKDVGINVRHKVEFYVLVGYNTTIEQDKYRCRLLKNAGTNAFVMQYGSRTRETKQLAWWANRKQAYWSCDVDEVKR